MILLPVISLPVSREHGLTPQKNPVGAAATPPTLRDSYRRLALLQLSHFAVDTER